MAPGRNQKSRKPSAGDSRKPARNLSPWVIAGIITGGAMIYFLPLLTGSAYLWEDFLYSTYPVRVFAATSMAMGEIPLWNPYSFGGMPFFADIINSVFYLPSVALVAFVRHGALNYYPVQLMVLLHFPLAGVSMYFLGRSFSLRQLPSLFAGIAYMLTGYMVLHAIHEPVITLAAWIPLIFLSFRKALGTGGWTWVFIAALVLGHSTLCGFPQLSLYIYFFLFAYWIFEILAMRDPQEPLLKRAVRLAVRAGSVVALSLGIALIQLAPTNELAGLSKRAEITYQFATEGSLSWVQLLTLLVPKLLGSSGAGGYQYFGDGGYWNYWETGIYIGVLPLFLSIIAMVRWREKRHLLFFAGFGLFAILYALGGHFILHRFFFEFIPGFSRFKTPARIGILFAFCATLLSAFAFDDILGGQEQDSAARRKRLARTVGIIGGIAVALLLLVRAGAMDAALPFLQNADIRTVITENMNTAFVVVVLSLGALVWLVRKRTTSPAIAVIAVVFVDLYLFGANQNNGKTNPTEYFREARQIVTFLQREGEHEYFRVNTRNPQGMIMDRNQGMVDRIFSMEGYTPLALQRTIMPIPTERYFDLENVKYKTVTEGNRLALVPNLSYLPRAFMVYRTHSVTSEDSLVAYMSGPAFDERSIAALEEPPPRGFTQDTTNVRWSAEVTSYGDNSMTMHVQTERPGLLVVSETFFPGWSAFVDNAGVPIIRCDYKLRGVVVPGGDHTVRMVYAPASYKVGAMATAASLLICGGGITILELRKRRRHAA